MLGEVDSQFLKLDQVNLLSNMILSDSDEGNSYSGDFTSEHLLFNQAHNQYE